MKIVYIISDDKIGRISINALGKENHILLNHTIDVMRVFKLIRNGVIKFSDIFKIGIANLCRSNQEIPSYDTVKTNEDLLQYLISQKPDFVICYRAGLVVNKKLLELGPQFLNIHCADLPKFPGLGSIPQALRENALDQNACLHRMALKVDAGKVIYKQPYKLSIEKSFRENEDSAYAAGRKILLAIEKGDINLEELL